MDFSYLLDSRFRGNDTLDLAYLRRGELFYLAKVLRTLLGGSALEVIYSKVHAYPFLFRCRPKRWNQGQPATAHATNLLPWVECYQKILQRVKSRRSP